MPVIDVSPDGATWPSGNNPTNVFSSNNIRADYSVPAEGQSEYLESTYSASKFSEQGMLAGATINSVSFRPEVGSTPDATADATIDEADLFLGGAYRNQVEAPTTVTNADATHVFTYATAATAADFLGGACKTRLKFGGGSDGEQILVDHTPLRIDFTNPSSNSNLLLLGVT